jgi:uncharacterized protein (DUF1330 family)
VVIIRFPAADAAARWYESADYRRILPLRLNNSTCLTALVTGVAPGHSGSSKAVELH